MNKFVSPDMRRDVIESIDEALQELRGRPHDWFDVAELHALAEDAADTGSADLLDLIRRRVQDLVAMNRRTSSIVLVAKHVAKVKKAAGGER